MLDDLKKLFSRTWGAFLEEAGRREPEDQVAELLAAMRREMVQARADLPLYEKNVAAAAAELERERRALEDAVRRGGMAERIGDAETVRVARDFAERHRQRVAVLEEKLRAATAELTLRRAESDEMMKRYKEADANRFILLSELRRRGAHARLDAASRSGDPSDPLDRFSRMEERVATDSAYADALDDLASDTGSAPPPPRPTVDDQLAELKRRMGQG
jgi:phage shock protein A